jgi:hypothetical protein
MSQFQKTFIDHRMNPEEWKYISTEATFYAFVFPIETACLSSHDCWAHNFKVAFNHSQCVKLLIALKMVISSFMQQCGIFELTNYIFCSCYEVLRNKQGIKPENR